ncbi:MAG: tetratricopeptide repeat protein [Cyanobacteria bacterium P01_G01_bin.54]
MLALAYQRFGRIATFPAMLHLSPEFSRPKPNGFSSYAWKRLLVSLLVGCSLTGTWALGTLKSASAQSLPILPPPSLDTPNQFGDRPPSYTETEANRLFRLGQDAKAAGQTTRAIGLWRGALEQYQLIFDLPAMGAVYNHLGFAYLELGDYRAAEDALRRSLAVASDLNDYSQQVYGYNNIGTLLLNNNNPQAAADAFRSAVRVARSIGDEPGEGLSLSNLGLAIATQGDPTQALEIYRQAWLLRRRYPERGGQASTLNNIGDAYAALKQYDQAVGEYRLARWYAHDNGDLPNEFRALGQLALNYGLSGRWPQAFATLEDWVLLAREHQNLRQELRALHIYAQYYGFLGRWENSYKLYSNAIAVAEQLGDREGVEILHSEQAQIVHQFPFPR